MLSRYNNSDNKKRETGEKKRRRNEKKMKKKRERKKVKIEAPSMWKCKIRNDCNFSWHHFGWTKANIFAFKRNEIMLQCYLHHDGIGFVLDGFVIVRPISCRKRVFVQHFFFCAAAEHNWNLFARYFDSSCKFIIRKKKAKKRCSRAICIEANTVFCKE